jgi:hypothetical protein
MALAKRRRDASESTRLFICGVPDVKAASLVIVTAKHGFRESGIRR